MMELYWDEEQMTIVRENFSFHPVINIPDPFYSSSITIQTESDEALALNLTGVPVRRLMVAIMDLKSSTFRLSPSLMHAIDLAIVGANGTSIRPKSITFEEVWMTTGNCTNGKKKEIYFHLIKSQ